MDDNFMLQRLIEMTKGIVYGLYVAFLDMGNTHDKVNRRKLFEIMREYGIQKMLD